VLAATKVADVPAGAAHCDRISIGWAPPPDDDPAVRGNGWDRLWLFGCAIACFSIMMFLAMFFPLGVTAIRRWIGI
jgi:hypothetical protein